MQSEFRPVTVEELEGKKRRDIEEVQELHELGWHFKLLMVEPGQRCIDLLSHCCMQDMMH